MIAGFSLILQAGVVGLWKRGGADGLRGSVFQGFFTGTCGSKRKAIGSAMATFGKSGGRIHDEICVALDTGGNRSPEIAALDQAKPRSRPARL